MIEYLHKMLQLCHVNRENFSVKELLLVLLLIMIISFVGYYLKIKGKRQKFLLKEYLITALLFAYLGFMFYVAVYSRQRIGQRVLQMQSLQYDERMNQNLTNFLNVLFFIPFGMILCMIQENKKTWVNLLVSLCVSFTTSMCIESAQYFLKRGYFELDDIQTNLIGALIGIFLVIIFRRNNRDSSAPGSH